jgi:cytochrome c heme-lyase
MAWFSFSSSSAKQEEQARSLSSSACPVDHSTRSAYLNNSPSSSSSSSASPGSSTNPHNLPTERVISSIPRYYSSSPTDTTTTSSPSACPASSHSDSNHDATTTETPHETQPSKWVYPSPSQFYAALERKNRSPDARDMPVVVPIHNAVNERCWTQILDWEREAGVKEGKVSLVSFRGRPRDRTPRAWWYTLLG